MTFRSDSMEVDLDSEALALALALAGVFFAFVAAASGSRSVFCGAGYSAAPIGRKLLDGTLNGTVTAHTK
jgi:hypothetical protein